MAKPATTSRPFGGSSAQNKKSSLKSTIRDQSGAGKTKLGELLSKEGYITKFQLDEALKYQKKHDGRLGSILLRLGYVDDDTIVSVLSRVYNYPAVVISKITPDPKAIEALPYKMAKKYMAFPIRLENDELGIAMAEPTDTTAVEMLQHDVKKNLEVSVSSEKDIVDAYKQYYGIDDEEYKSFFGESTTGENEEEEALSGVDDFGSLVSEALEDIELSTPADAIDDVADQYSASDGPIIKLVNGILVTAINEGVSDIHIEPFENSLQVRYRLDGSLFKSKNFPVSIKSGLTSRIKILAGLNIAERRVPQDGRIKLKMGKKTAVDFRVSTLPTLFGESTVLRILDKSALNVDLTKMGFEVDTFDALKRCINRPYGLLLVTGPTGSGKTTTLYSVLNRLNKEDTKILTAEDPVEFNFKGINQVLVRDEVGMTFAAALKSFLRQDPDIIMVGEIRDQETAEIAIKAAMTGHLVFSTLHTNDCPSTIGRLVDIGIPPYMLASSVSMILSQRLARKLCPKCRVEVKHYPTEELEQIGFHKDEIPDLKLYGPGGCSECKGSGYKGRVGLYELMEVNDDVGKAINASVPEDQLRKTAIQNGMNTLREAALIKARQGVISIEEVVKRTVVTKESLPAYLVTPDEERYEDKDVIIREGNSDIDFFRLIQGALVVIKEGKKIAEITEPGDYFGEMSVITGEPRSATILSKGRSVIKRFPGDKLPELMEKYPDVARHLFGVLATRLHRANEITVNLINERLQQR
jgi:type IV pilus assembly protein PilB